MKGKKAFVFTLFVVISTLIILIIGMAGLYAKQNKFNGRIGKEEAAIISAYTETEKTLFYLDYAAKIAAYEALDALTLKETGCGSYNGLPLWNNAEKKCYPNIIESYKQVFNIIFEEKISVYNKIPFIRGLALPYGYEIAVRPKKNTDIIGTAPMGLYYLNATENINYKQLPNFKVEANFNIDNLEEMKSVIIQFLVECSGVAEPEIGKCGIADERRKIGNECLQNDQNDGIVPVCYTFRADNPFASEKDIIFKFAMTLPKAKLLSFCCSPESKAEGIDCKKDTINGWWSAIGECKRMSSLQKFADQQENKVCCLS